MSTPEPKWYTDCSVVVVSASPVATAQAFEQYFNAEFPHSGISVRPGLDRVVVLSPVPLPALRDCVAQAIENVNATPGTQTKGEGRAHTIHVRYEGIDIGEVGNTLGMSRDAVIMAHTRTTWRVGMLGFAPGFPYLIPSHPHPWSELPRRESPREKVPAGAVAVAAGMSSIYPSVLPGGWHIIGVTDVELFNPEKGSAPTLFKPGDTVKFEVA